MRKKISLFIFTLFISLIFVNGASAEIFQYTCDYDNTASTDTLDDHVKYSIKYEYNAASQILSIADCTATFKHGGNQTSSCNSLEFEPVSWKNTNCPNSFNIVDNKIELQKNYKDAEYIHYWEWTCEYNLSELDNDYFTSLNVKYRNTALTNSGYSVIYVDISHDPNLGDDEKKNAEITSTTFVSVINKANECTPITFSTFGISNEKADIYFSEAGNIKGKLKKFNYYRTSAVKTGESVCTDYFEEGKCETDSNVACVWTDNLNAPNGGFCNVDNLLYVGCGGASDIPIQVPQLIAFAVNALKIATPIILIFMGMITLLKAMSSGKEDEMKKATSSLIKKLIAAAMVFFVVAIVQFIVSKVTSDEDDYTNFSNCLKCFLNNDCENAYYKTVVGGEDYCTQLTTGEPKVCNSTEEK